MPSQDMCPICCESFKSTEIIIEYQKWGNMKLLAHLDCALVLSKAEDRKHPPQSKKGQ
jgi:hypothetical protein